MEGFNLATAGSDFSSIASALKMAAGSWRSGVLGLKLMMALLAPILGGG